jgi:serine protease Do
MAVGNPGGLEFNSSVTIGYVSALNREITNSDTGYTMKCIQTDAAINPGNSGGALVNMKGQVIGINSSKIVATGYEGLGFSIPIDEAQPVISELKQYGYVKDRAVLGITGQYLDSTTSRFYGLPTGMYVASITSSAVSNAGIQKGDIITKINGAAVSSQTTITSLIASKKPVDTVTLSVTRSLTGQTFTATVKLSQATGK